MIRQEDLDAVFCGAPNKDPIEQPPVEARVLPGGIVVISIKGHILSQSRSLHIFDQIRDLIRGQHPHLILDLKECEYLSFILLGSIAGVAKDDMRPGFQVFVAGANETIKDVMRLTGLDKDFLKICNTVEDAVKALEDV